MPINVPMPVINIGRVGSLLHDPAWVALAPLCHVAEVGRRGCNDVPYQAGARGESPTRGADGSGRGNFRERSLSQPLGLACVT